MTCTSRLAQPLRLLQAPAPSRRPRPAERAAVRAPRRVGWAGLRALFGLLALAAGGAGGRSARAQPPVPVHHPVPPPAAGARVDTMWVDTTVRPGRQDFTPYATPAWCLAAAQAAEALARRAEIDSTGYQPERDTLTAAAVTTARRCGAHFTPEAVPASTLLDLMHLALMAGDDVRAAAAAARYVAAVPEPEAHRWALYAVDTTYLNSRPMRRVVAEAITARLDSLGPTAALQRTLAHKALHQDAQRRYDVERLRREILALLTACHQQSARDSLDVESDCTEASLVLELFLAELYRDPTGAVHRTRQLVSATGFKDWDTFQTLLRISRLDWVVAQMGKPVPSLQAEHWVGPAGRAAGWPVRGKVSIFLRGSPEQDDPQKMARWKRLGEEFKDALDITVLVATQGIFVADNTMLGVAPLLLTPAEEATRVGRYYQEQLGLPVTVAVAETPVRLALPPPDGRRILGEPPLQKDPFYGSEFLLADRDGKFLLGPFISEEPLVHAWVARAVGH